MPAFEIDFMATESAVSTWVIRDAAENCFPSSVNISLQEPRLATNRLKALMKNSAILSFHPINFPSASAVTAVAAMTDLGFVFLSMSCWSSTDVVSSRDHTLLVSLAK